MSISIREIFDASRDPLRDLTLIIQVQDTSASSLWTEFEEFVLTETLLKYLGEFITEFSSSTLFDKPKMPIWLEGFYGSGKSHFAKIIGLLLKNAELTNPLNEKFSSMRFFIDHILNDMIFTPDQKDLKRIRDETVQSLEILPKRYNTQTIFIYLGPYAKSESTTDSHLESFSYVLMSEFNAILGLSSEIETAEIERHLIRDNIYDAFKQKVLELKGKTWEKTRESASRARMAFIDTFCALKNCSEIQATAYIDGAIAECKQRNVNKALYEINLYAAETLSSPSEGIEGRILIILDEAGNFFKSTESRLGELQSSAEWVLNPMNKSRIQMIFIAQQALQKHLEESKMRVDFHKAEQRFKHWVLGKESIKTVVVKRWLKKDTLTKGKQLIDLIDKKFPEITDGTIFQTLTDPKRDYISPKREEITITYPLLPYQFPLMIQVTQKLIEKKIVQEEYGGRTRSVLSMTRDILNNRSPFSTRTHFIEDPIGTFVNLAQIYDSIIYTLRRREEDQTALVEATKGLEEVSIEPTPEERALKISFSDVAKAIFLFQFIDELQCNDDNITKSLYYSVEFPKTLYSEKVKKILEVLKKKGYISSVKREIRNERGEIQDFWQYKIATQEEKQFTEHSSQYPVDEQRDIPEILNEFLKGALGKDLFNIKDAVNINTLYGKAGKAYTLKNAFKPKVNWYFDPDLEEVLGKIGDAPSSNIHICLLTNRTLYDSNAATMQQNLQHLPNKILLLSKKAYQKKQLLLFITPSFSQAIDKISFQNRKIVDYLSQIYRIKKALEDYSHNPTIIVTFDQRRLDLQKDLLKILKDEWMEGLLYSGDGDQTRLNRNTFDSILFEKIQLAFSKINPIAYLGQVKITQEDIKAILTWDPNKSLVVSKTLIKTATGTSSKNEIEAMPLFSDTHDLQPNLAEQYNHLNVEFRKAFEKNDVVSGKELYGIFTSPPYLWKDNTFLGILAAVIRNNEWDVLSGSEVKGSDDPKILDAFTDSKDDFGKLQKLSFKIAEKLNPEQLALVSAILRDLFMEQISSPGYDSVDFSIKKTLGELSTIILETKVDLQNLAFNAELLNLIEGLYKKVQDILGMKRPIERIRAFLDHFQQGNTIEE